MNEPHTTISRESEQEAPFSETVPLATPKPIQAQPIPQNPYMASNGRSNIHDDAYMTDTYVGRGPLGGHLRVKRAILGGIPATVTFDRQGRINALAITPTGVRRLALLEPDTLKVLAIDDKLLPSKDTGGDFGGGGYFYLNHLDQLVVPTADLTVMIIGVSAGEKPEFQPIQTYDLRAAIQEADGPSFDDSESIQSALPDWQNRLWFVTKYGIVGCIEPETEKISTYPLINPDTNEKEHIGNSFAMDETGGVFIVSDYALYRFDVSSDGTPVVSWREPYDHGTRLKPGQVNWGSGTTPTLLNLNGKGYVSITDNADPQMNVLVYRRERDFEGNRLVCQQPVFQDGASCTENSLIGVGNSFLVENNYGYKDVKTTVGPGITGHNGFTRVDFNEDGSGCQVKWTNDASVPSVVSKLSLANGLVYTYTKKHTGWYFTAIDFFDGTTRFEVRTGVSNAVNNHYAGLYLGPDGRAYVGVLSGLISVSQEHP